MELTEILGPEAEQVLLGAGMLLGSAWIMSAFWLPPKGASQNTTKGVSDGDNEASG